MKIHPNLYFVNHTLIFFQNTKNKLAKICNLIFWIKNAPPPLSPFWNLPQRSSFLVAVGFPLSLLYVIVNVFLFWLHVRSASNQAGTDYDNLIVFNILPTQIILHNNSFLIYYQVRLFFTLTLFQYKANPDYSSQ